MSLIEFLYCNLIIYDISNSKLSLHIFKLFRGLLKKIIFFWFNFIWLNQKQFNFFILYRYGPFHSQKPVIDHHWFWIKIASTIHLGIHFLFQWDHGSIFWTTPYFYDSGYCIPSFFLSSSCFGLGIDLVNISASCTSYCRNALTTSIWLT